MRLNIVLVVIVALLFGAPFIGSLEVGGASVILLRDIALMGICLLYLLNAGARRGVNHARLRVLPVWLVALGLFGLYVAANTLFSAQGVGALGIAIRTVVLGVVALTLIYQTGYRQIYAPLLLRLLSAYFLLSLASLPFSEDHLEGLLGRHYTKFVALSGFSLSIAMFAANCNRRLALVCGVLSVMVGALCLQRGFVIAAFVVVIVVLLFSNVSISGRIKILAAALVVAVAGWTLIGDRLLEYAFYQDVGPRKILQSLIDGTFELSMIRTRSRLFLADIVVSGSSVSLLGHGAGWSKHLLAAYYGGGKEPHNDFLVLLYDYGLVGVSLFGFFLFTLFLRIRRLKTVRDGALNPYALASGALMAGCVIWMSFSNVLIYSMSGLVFSIIFLAMAEAVARNKEIKC